MVTISSFRDWPLRRKLPLIVMATSGAALIIACAAFLLFDYVWTRGAARNQLEGLAKLISEQSALAVEFPDRTAAESILASLVRDNPDIERAEILDARGGLIARWVSGGAEGRPRTDLLQDLQQVKREVKGERGVIGQVALWSNQRSMRTRVQLGIVVTAVVLAISSLVAFLLGLRLGRVVVDPVQALAGTMRQVSESRRTDVRVAEAGKDEIGDLVRGFNVMLGRIEEREAELTRLATIIEGTSDFVGIADPRGNVLYVNRAGRRMCGIGDDEDVSRSSIADFHPSDVARMVMEKAAPAAAKDGSWMGESSLLCRDGRTLPVSQMLLVHRGPQGETLFLSTIIRDMSEIRKAQDALRRSEEQLQSLQKMEALGRLAGGVAHDFNNLLTVIGGYAQLLFAGLGKDDGRHENVRMVIESVDRASALTRQLLAFSRRQVIQPRVLDLNVTIRDAEKMLRRLIGENIELVTQLDPNLGHLKGDPGQMEQVLMNLVVNARDAMPRGGRLILETSAVELAPAEAIEFGLSGSGPHVALRVKDNGQGMDAATMAHLFEPFFTTKEKGTGWGLGLSPVYGIVRQSGGAISADSRPGEGSAFRVLFPCAEGELATPAGPAPVARPTGGRETILVVEDESGVRGLIRAALTDAGYTVLDSSHSKEALRMSREHAGRIDLLVTDVVMPGMGGPELARRLRQQRPGLKGLFISGYPEDDLGPEMEAGMGFLGKPFSPDALTRKIRELLDQPVDSRKGK